MIPNIQRMWQPQTWQSDLQNVVTELPELLERLKLSPHDFPNVLLGSSAFSLKVPFSYLERMKPGDPRDPLLLQVLPQGLELLARPGFTHDPLDEASHNQLPGLLHKYQGRALLILSSSCAIHCRYCFRREFPYEANKLGGTNLSLILDYLKRDASIHEVILSGGDPLMHKDAYLKNLVEKLSSIKHLKTLRIHSRLPVVIPKRLTDTLIEAISTTRLKPVLVIHCNHPNELNAELQVSLKKLKAASILVLNQTVLLKGVNDSPAVLEALSLALFDNDVLPYYLNLLDRVTGSGHFEVSIEEAKQIMSQLIARLPGYLVPRLVQEQGQAQAKVPIAYAVPNRLASSLTELHQD